ncbi:RNA polymerase sigma factor [Phaeodactylibacter xiamenensis]|uniref:RNA polymerase sigma factor n=1 Tax=Phaeodactylibacter xiamenensis TaxID=1524460 RepID=UPI0024A90D51|nr:sigma-70 family RNA polymerase sigma factor [Phaeodactylibacter xiamenensis]
MDQLDRLRSEDPKVRRAEVKAIYEPAYMAILRHISANSGHEHDAKDMLHKAWEVFERKIANPAFKLTVPAEGYLLGVAKRLWLKQLEKKRKINVTSNEIPDFQEEEPQGGDRESAIQRVVELLSQEAFQVCRKVIVNFYRGWSMEEIAEDMGFSGSDSAKSKKAKCMKKLRAICRKDAVLLQLFDQ